MVQILDQDNDLDWVHRLIIDSSETWDSFIATFQVIRLINDDSWT